jgi:hypothetical protein
VEREPVIERPVVSQEDRVDVESLSDSDDGQATDESIQPQERHETSVRQEEVERHDKPLQDIVVRPMSPALRSTSHSEDFVDDNVSICSPIRMTFG